MIDKEVEEVIDRVKQTRVDKGISVVKLSVDSGVSRSHLFYIESKRTIPSLDTLCKIAHAMDLTLKDFFIEPEKTKKNDPRN